MNPPGVAGADEAGRGPLAGPVVAAAVLLPPGFDPIGLNDSKKLTPDQRLLLETQLLAGAEYAIEAAEPDEIDRLNILHASLAAMGRAIIKLNPPKVFVDGNRLPQNLPCEAEAVVKGDGKYACIAAASILAKVARDRLMAEYAENYPDYGFERHFGYPTPEHLAALARYGPCLIHRRSFGPVRQSLHGCSLPEGGQLCLTIED